MKTTLFQIKKRSSIKRTVVILLFLIILVMVVVIKSDNTYFPKEDSFNNLFSKLSISNGINTTRGYGQKAGISPVIIKFLFNKLFYLASYLMGLLTFVFSKLMQLIVAILF